MSTEIVARSQFEESIDGSNKAFISFEVKTPEDRKKLYKIINNPDERLADFINKKIALKDFYWKMVEVVNEQTGEVQNAPRIVLIDADGKSYQAVSKGIQTALVNLVSCCGFPANWEEPIEVEVKQVKKGVRQFLTLVMSD